jgi:Mlc titration factor MtfA (ptsG expression regulator)
MRCTTDSPDARGGRPHGAGQTGAVPTTVAPTAPWLTDDDRRRMEWHRADLIRRVRWEGARDVEVDPAMVATIAAHAAVMVAGFEPKEAPFHLVTTVIVHDGTYVSREPRPGPVSGSVTTTPRRLAGQSGHGRGPLLIDWRTVEREVEHPERGCNVVVHEFAHKLDQLTGVADGMPPLPDRGAREAWVQTIGTNYRRLRRRGPDGLVRAYGATSPAEYFAVTSELFFTRGADLATRLPRVYRRLADFYRQDPAG